MSNFHENFMPQSNETAPRTPEAEFPSEKFEHIRRLMSSVTKSKLRFKNLSKEFLTVNSEVPETEDNPAMFSDEKIKEVLSLNQDTLENKWQKKYRKEPIADDLKWFEHRQISEQRKKYVTEEYRRILITAGLLQKNQTSHENNPNKVFLENRECFQNSEVEGIMTSFEEKREHELGGDFLIMKKERSEDGNILVSDATLLDLKGHGEHVNPYAVICAKFIEEGLSLGIPFNEVMQKLDLYVAGLPDDPFLTFTHTIIRKDISKRTKELSFFNGGDGGFLFWIEGDRREGYRLKMNGDIGNSTSTYIEKISLKKEESSDIIGIGEFDKAIREGMGYLPKNFTVPFGRSIYLMTDGIPELPRSNDKEFFKYEFTPFIERFFQENEDTVGNKIDAKLYQALQDQIKKEPVGDDITLVKFN